MAKATNPGRMNMDDEYPDQTDEREEADQTQDDEPGRSAAERAKQTERRMEESGQESPA
jgi:hypothetical protein